MSRKRALAALYALVALSVVAAGAVSVAQAENPQKSASKSLVGTWHVRLSIPGAPPGRVLATFNRDGTTVESVAAPPMTRGASHGVWKRIGPDLFSVTRVFFRFEGGNFVGTQKVNATVRVAPDGQTFAAVSISQMYDPAGNAVGPQFRGTAQGTRMHVEEIPDRPGASVVRSRLWASQPSSSRTRLPGPVPPSMPERHPSRSR